MRHNFTVSGFLLGMLLMISQAQAGSGDSFDWASNSYYGVGRYFVLRPSSRVKKGDSMLVLGRLPGASATSTVVDIIDVAPIKQIFEERGFDGVYKDKKLYDEIGWYWGLRSALALSRVARLSSGGSIAVSNLKNKAIILDGPQIEKDGAFPTMDLSATQALLQTFRQSFEHKTCLGDNPLIKAIRYGPQGGHEVIELFVGSPAYFPTPHAGATMDSIQMCESIVADGSLLRTWEYERNSQDEESVESGPPLLNEATWFVTMDKTLNYVSIDGGMTWRRAVRNDDSEGTTYRIENEADGTDLFKEYLSTPH